jgi:hypothetical protein
MDLPPLPDSLPSGWSIDDSHICSIYIHPDSVLPYLASLIELPAGKRKCTIDTLLDYIAVNANAVLESTTFLQTPVPVLQLVLSYPCLSLDEDKILDNVMRYVKHHTGVDCSNVCLLSDDEREAIRPLASLLVPSMALMSLSTAAFIHRIEPLQVLSIEELTWKYKYDALRAEALSVGRSERQMVVDMFCGSSCLVRDAYERMPWAREAYVVSESAHPYEVGGEEDLELVAVAGWAGRTLVEFEPRSCVAPDARLSIYGDSDGRKVLADWSQLWRKGGVLPGGRRFLIVPGNKFWIGFKCPARAMKPLWGWKLRARPVVDVDDESE